MNKYKRTLRNSLILNFLDSMCWTVWRSCRAEGSKVNILWPRGEGSFIMSLALQRHCELEISSTAGREQPRILFCRFILYHWLPLSTASTFSCTHLLLSWPSLYTLYRNSHTGSLLFSHLVSVWCVSWCSACSPSLTGLEPSGCTSS